MKLKQLAVFLQNQPGHLNGICRALAVANINIATLSLADTQQFGILRLIIKEWERAVTVLEAAGYLVQIRDVIATEVSDRPGGMADILDVVSRADINIEYMYAFAERPGNRAVLVFRFADPDRAIAALTAANINVLSSVDVFGP
ncbi:MAG: ACT domain-containing protein [Kiritimatiellaeota bacterium]|nr:ACT domain-containing protein [Kiritimatiellota bacterium]